MKFAHPDILYFLLLLIIPIIIHLFNFRRYKKIYFSSLAFIKKVEKETNSARNLRHYIILACRLLAFAALIIAFAQPYSSNFPTQQSHENIIPIYLDNSFSMTAKGSNGDLLNQAKTTVREMADKLPLDQKYMLLTNNMDGSEHQIITYSELIDRIDAVQHAPISRSIANPLRSIYEFLQSNAYTGDSHYFIFSDFQKRFLDEKQVKLDTLSHYSLVQFQPEINRNLYIDSVWFEQPYQRVNTNNTLNIRIQNTGKESLTNVELNLKVGNTKRQTLADIDANNHTVVSMNYTHKTTGIKSGKVEVADENLYFDNHFYFTYKVKENVNVFVINGAQNSNYPQQAYETDDFYQVTQTPIDQLKTNSLNTADLVVLNEIRNLSSGIQTQLKQLVENGVYLLIIPPANFDNASYNALLGSFQLPLYREFTQQEIRIGKVNSELEFFSGMFDQKVDQLRVPPLKSYISSTTYTQANFMNMIAYENDMPLLVSSANKQVFAFYTPIHSKETAFGKSALFVSTLLRIGEMSQGKTLLNLTMGSSDEYVIRRKGQKENAVILKQEELEFIPEISNRLGFTSISVRNTSDNQLIRDGIYNIISNQEEIGQLALNYNRMESDMDYATTQEIAEYFKSLHITKLDTKEISSFTDIAHFTIQNSNEYWRIFLVVSLAFFLMEMLIIIFWKV